MIVLNLKPTDQPIKDYYDALDQFNQRGFTNETAVRSAFQSLLQHYGRRLNWILVPEYSMTPPDKGDPMTPSDKGDPMTPPSQLTITHK
jgi:hypothetical protein